jgi:hypothetical protein
MRLPRFMRHKKYGFVKSPISAKASLRVCVALHPVAIAAYHKYASSHGICDALNLNFLLCRLECDFLRVHQICQNKIKEVERF